MIEFTVDFPQSLNKNQLTDIRNAFKEVADEIEEVSAFIEEPLVMKKFSETTANPDVHGGKEHPDQ